MDRELTSKQHLAAYYYFTQHYLEKPFARFQSGGANLPRFGDLTDERIQQLNVSHTWAVGTGAVNEARFTMFREGQGTFLHPQHTDLVRNSCKTVPSANCFADPNNPNLGIHPALGTTREGVPFINISGGFNIGNNFEGELPQVGNRYQWSDNFNKTVANTTSNLEATSATRSSIRRSFSISTASTSISAAAPMILNTGIYSPIICSGFPTNTDRDLRRKNWFAASPSISSRKIAGRSNRA